MKIQGVFMDSILFYIKYIDINILIFYIKYIYLM